MERMKSLQTLLMDLCGSFIGVSAEKVNAVILQALEKMGRFLEADRACLFRYETDLLKCANTHEWCNEGIQPHQSKLGELPVSVIAPLWEAHVEGGLYYVEDVALLPENPLKTFLLNRQVQSMVAFPMMENDSCLGFVSLDAVRCKRQLTDEETTLLGGFAQTMVKLIVQHRIEQQVNASERILAEREKQLDMFFNQSMAGFFMTMLDEPVQWDNTIDKEKTLDYVFAHQRITRANQALLNQYGARMEEFVGLTPNDLFAHDLTHGRQIWREFLDKGQYHVHTWEKKFDGTPMLVEGDYICLYDEESRITGHFGVQEDVTERKKAEEKLQELNAMLERNNVELDLAAQQAEAATHAKSQFLANMSHEIRTPMNGILGFLQLLEETRIDTQQARYIDYIKTSTDTLLALINDILDLSKIESGKMELEKIPFDLGSTLEDAVITQAHRAHSKGLELNLHLFPGLPHQVKGDPTRLRQILTNLISNAVKFTEKGSVTVACHEIDQVEGTSTIAISVTDTGIGIPENAQETLFEAFTQADTSTTREYGGSGLGLAITRDLVKLMNGHIQLESTPGKGSTFTLSLPLPIDHTQVRELISHQALLGKHIHIVDDIALNREILRNYLEETGCQVTESSRGIDTIDRLIKVIQRGEPVDAVIIDQQMPGMSGLDLAAALKAIPSTNFIPLCLTSSAAEEGSGKKATSQGFSAFLTKPLRRRDLLDTLASMVTVKQQPTDMPSPLITRHTIQEAHYRQKVRVLVVEDQPVNQALVVQLLQNRGIRCDIAENGQEAVEACCKETYHLVLMDVQMPVMDGMEATRQIRQLTGIKQPLIAAMTAHAMKEDKERCLAAGMNAYLTKPIDLIEVSALLEEGMTRAEEIEWESNAPKKYEGDYSSEAALSHNAALSSEILEQMIHETGFDQYTAEEMLSQGIISWQHQMFLAEVALEQEDWVEIKRLLHNIAGSAANLRAVKMAQRATEGITHAANGDKENVDKTLTKIRAMISHMTGE